MFYFSLAGKESAASLVIGCGDDGAGWGSHAIGDTVAVAIGVHAEAIVTKVVHASTKVTDAETATSLSCGEGTTG